MGYIDLDCQKKTQSLDKKTARFIFKKVIELLTTNAEHNNGTFWDGKDIAYRQVLRVINDILDE